MMAVLCNFKVLHKQSVLQHSQRLMKFRRQPLFLRAKKNSKRSCCKSILDTFSAISAFAGVDGGLAVCRW